MILHARFPASWLDPGWPLLASGLARAQAPRANAASLAKGDVIPAFETLGIDGKAEKVEFPKGSKTSCSSS